MNQSTPPKKALSSEEKILAAVDSLAQLLFELYQIEPGPQPSQQILDDPKLHEAFASLIPLLLPMINYRQELLPQIITQLFLQKMPFSSDPIFSLYYIHTVQSITALLPENYPQQQVPTTDEQTFPQKSIPPKAAEELSPPPITPAPVSIPDPAPESPVGPLFEPEPQPAALLALSDQALLQRLLAWTFPSEEAQFEFSYHGQKLAAYLPHLRLAIQLDSAPHLSQRTLLWLKKDHIRLIQLEQMYLEQPQKFRKLCQKALRE